MAKNGKHSDPELVIWPPVEQAFASLWDIPGDAVYVALEVRTGRVDVHAFCFLFPATSGTLDLFTTCAYKLGEYLDEGADDA